MVSHCCCLLHPSSLLCEKAWTIGLRQHSIFPSPNSGWSEAAAAGALSVRLIGPIWHEGRLIVDRWLGHPKDPFDLGPQEIHHMISLAQWVTLAFVMTSLPFFGSVPPFLRLWRYFNESNLH